MELFQYLHVKYEYSVGPKSRKEQQVYIKNPKYYIIPHDQSTVKNVADNQQAKTVDQQGTEKSFAKHHGGPGDNRSFV